MNSFKEWLSDYLRYFILALAVLLAIGAIVLGVKLYQSSQQTSAPGEGGTQNGSIAESGSETEGPAIQIITESSKAESESETQKETETETVKATEAETEKATEAKTEKATEKTTEKVTEKAAETKKASETTKAAETSRETEKAISQGAASIRNSGTQTTPGETAVSGNNGNNSSASSDMIVVGDGTPNSYNQGTQSGGTKQTEAPATEAPETDPPQTDPPETDPPEPVYLTMTGACYIRSYADYGDNIIGEYPAGTVVEFLEDVGGWYKVQVDGMVGYMGARFFR